MKTLIFFGAARKNGSTKAMIDMLTEHLEGEIDIIDAYRVKGISPCLDCRFCLKNKGCAIKDGMQDIYNKIEQANNIVFASPMYFHCVTGPLKIIIDRLQTYWASQCVRKEAPQKGHRKGAILMAGGAPSFDQQFLAGELVLNGVLGDLSAENVGCVSFSNTDQESLENREDIKKKIIKIAEQLNLQN